MLGLSSYLQFRSCVRDLIIAEPVRQMDNFTQHSDISTLEHCIFVAYVSFLMCRFIGLNFYAAARGALLHDMFLYDWHYENKSDGPHSYCHPATALKNANYYFDLTDMEQDIIEKHMWPFCIKSPKYAESLVVSFADKFCAVAEVCGLYQKFLKTHTAICLDVNW